MNMIGGLFQRVGTDASLSLNGQFANDAMVATAGEGADEADTIMTFDARTQGYDKIYFFYYLDGDEAEYNNKWYDTDDNSEPTDAIVAGGAAGWYRNRSSSSIQIQMAGEVPTNALYQVTLRPGMNFVANPYPAAIPLNGNTFSVDNATSGEGADEADTIMTFNVRTQSYDKIYFFYYLDGDEEDYNNKWYDTDDNSEPTEVALNPGVGFWYRYRGTGTATLTFRKPY